MYTSFYSLLLLYYNKYGSLDSQDSKLNKQQNLIKIFGRYYVIQSDYNSLNIM